MDLLIFGLVIWCAVHFIPSVTPGVRTGLIQSVGEVAYKIAFSLSLIIAVFLMVWGWRSVDLTLVYVPPVWGIHATGLLVLVAFILMAAANTRNNIRRFLRHPQLSGIVLWSVGHLLANGENRSLVLFGVFAVWAIAEMFLINRRDGQWQKPEPVPVLKDIIAVIAGVAVAVVFVFIHPYLFGVSPIPG